MKDPSAWQVFLDLLKFLAIFHNFSLVIGSSINASLTKFVAGAFGNYGFCTPATSRCMIP